MTDREFFVMLNGAYPQVPYAPKRGSNYIDLPNSVYDKAEGQRVLERQLRTFVSLEELGYDGGVVSEQHNGPIGLLGNPMLAGAYVAAQTKSIKIGVVGPIINGYLTPLRMAEEYAALDIMSRGRLLLGLPMGHGMQYHSIGAVNPATARARYREAHDLFIKALTHDGPFEWFGEFYQIPYVNLWPRPLQDKPDIVILGGGSQETLEMVAKQRYGYQAVGALSQDAMWKAADKLRRLCEAEGYTAAPKQVWSMVSVHVAETDEQARLEAEAHSLWTSQNFFLSPFHDNFPPAYLTAGSMRGVLGGGYRSESTDKSTFDRAIENGTLIVGSPETVLKQMEAMLERVGPGRVLLDPMADTKPEWLANKTLQLFAEEVLPKLRQSTKKGPETQGFNSLAEYGAKRGETPAPLVTFGDGLVNAQTAHVAEARTVIEPWSPKA
ncbi:LLM class flavin-dependent oxidoreductase [Nonomuraea sp. NPDC026600]|uniref:LLM class flavin-dependent oxidoreductase n=1 Tax=Nonomuraea sp. NPDC026600 TaxID=3155363 RepID=UPI00340354DE